MSGSQSFTFAILGAGGRGNVFSQWLQRNPQAGKVVAVAEPIAERRCAIAQRHAIPCDLQFERWEDLLARPKLADVILNGLMDKLHAPSAVKALNKGYHMLLEKPMATTLEDCIAIDKARRESKRIVSVCHSLRYHVVYSEVKRLLNENTIGRLISFDQLEGVEPIHQSHSFVRGNWGNEGRSTFMLMAKSCHDVDIIAFLVGKNCRRVSSFGELSLFRKENAPAGAPLRCTDGCPVESSCPYSAYKIYLGEDAKWWATHAGIGGKTFEQQIELLKHGPYGRCVYHCDNDVVDHQVVNFEFDDSVTGTFTMTAFSAPGRYLRLHGTHGTIYAETESNRIQIHRFADNSRTDIKIQAQSGSHGGADSTLMENLVHALRQNDPDAVLTTTSESLASHKIVFAAEKARREKRVVELSELR
jgi:predicted dehydrogenase